MSRAISRIRLLCDVSHAMRAVTRFADLAKPVLVHAVEREVERRLFFSTPVTGARLEREFNMRMRRSVLVVKLPHLSSSALVRCSWELGSAYRSARWFPCGSTALVPHSLTAGLTDGSAWLEVFCGFRGSTLLQVLYDIECSCNVPFMPEPYAVIGECRSCGHRGGRRVPAGADYVALMARVRDRAVCSQCGARVHVWLLWTRPSDVVEDSEGYARRLRETEAVFQHLAKGNSFS